MAAALKRPGLARGALGLLLGGAFGFGLVVALRAIWRACEIFQTEQTGYPQVIVPAIFAPLGFLVGLGAFDYWFRWAIGGPTYPAELEHADHGAYSWRDYFKFNTDHKVIGIQYICTTFIFFFIGGAAGDADARRAGPAGHPDRRARAPSTGSSRPTPRS